MKNEIKIVLPFYKLAYSFSFIVILSLIRGIMNTYEIGIAIEAPAAILTSVFCADTYVQEIVSRRSEVYHLYPIKKRKAFIIKRLLIQTIFLIFLEILGYALFFVFQKPRTNMVKESETEQFLLANMLSILFCNIWAGIGGCLVVWLATNSTGGDRILGVWNLFSYTFRKIEHSIDFSWIYGKVFCMIFIIFMLMTLPKLLRKRG